MQVRKRLLGITVLEAARQRIAWVFNVFPRIIVSFSGGKDSTLMLHLIMEEAVRRKRKVVLIFIDWEAQYQYTINHVRHCFELYREYIEPYWLCIPLLTTNACSQFEPEWICWEKGKEELWVRPIPKEDYVISIDNVNDILPFYSYPTTFEDLVELMGPYFAQGQLTATFVGIRTGESLNRWRTIAGHGVKWRDADGTLRTYVNYQGQTNWNIYPVYDWRPQDIWTYHGRTGKCYNPLYDVMHQAGLSLHQQRICEPYGDAQRRGLYLFKVVEPETWNRVVMRVAGANMGSEYANTSGNIMGNRAITLPPGHTWRSFAKLLLDSMPPATAEHYRNKISVWLNWYCKNEGYFEDTLPQELPGDLGGRDMPSWRRVCKVLLSNDYWCTALDFSPTKAGYYDKYRKIMEKRRRQWNFRF